MNEAFQQLTAARGLPSPGNSGLALAAAGVAILRPAGQTGTFDSRPLQLVRFSENMELYSQPSPQPGAAALQVNICFGPRNEPSKQAGFTHLYEHVLMRDILGVIAGSSRLKFGSEAFLNFGAETSKEELSLRWSGPERGLPAAAELLATVLFSTPVSRAAFETERGVITNIEIPARLEKSEVQRVAALESLLFGSHPIARSPIEDRRALNDCSYEEFMQFADRLRSSTRMIFSICGESAEARDIIGSAAAAQPVGQAIGSGLLPARIIKGTDYQHRPWESELCHLGVAFPGLPITDPRMLDLTVMAAALELQLGSRFRTALAISHQTIAAITPAFADTGYLGLLASVPNSAAETAVVEIRSAVENIAAGRIQPAVLDGARNHRSAYFRQGRNLPIAAADFVAGEGRRGFPAVSFSDILTRLETIGPHELGNLASWMTDSGTLKVVGLGRERPALFPAVS